MAAGAGQTPSRPGESGRAKMPFDDPGRRAMWLLKTEPGTYSYDDLERERRACWDGVRNPAALRNLRAMKEGDRALVYHTGEERAVVGEAEVVKAAHPDPKAKNPRLVVVDL